MTRSSGPAIPLVKPFAAIIFRGSEALRRGVEELEGSLSPVDFQGKPHPFSATSYYEPEMGGGLSRCLVSFSALTPVTFLARAKHAAAETERALSQDGKRTVNLDVGYLDLFKVVLASFKERGQKFYLEQGVWADMTLFYQEGGFQSLPWSFPDFKGGAYDGDLMTIRDRFKHQLRDTS